MKKNLMVLLLSLMATAAMPAPQLAPSQIKPSALAGSSIRKSPCQSSAGDNCGSEPPTHHITPDECGIEFSTSSARNESFSYAQNGTGAQTVFDFRFPFFNTSHLEVLVGGVLKTLGVDYTVSAPGPTGLVTFTTPPPVGTANVVIRLKTTWNGDGATTIFAYNFQINYIESLEVKVNNVLKTYSTDYTISGLRSTTGGTITFTAAPAVGTDNVSVKMVSLSTKGVKFTVPTVAEFIANGDSPGGASPEDGGQLNREGACRLGFIPAAPSPQNFPVIGIDGGVLGSDKFTNIWEGGPSIDFYDGEIKLPMKWGTAWWNWNGTSLLYDGVSSALGEHVSQGQTSSQGEGRLFVVTADYPWQTTGSKIGHLAYCPNNGRGLNTNANDRPTRALMPIGCAYAAPSGSSVDYVQITQNTGFFASDVTQGAAYIAGTSPDGVPYPAGNYVVVVATGAVNTLQNGNTMLVVSLPMTLGTKTSGKWLVKRLTPGVDPGCAGGSPACFELHEEVQDWNQKVVWGIGPPSAFLPGDTRRDAVGNVACCASHALSSVSLAGGRKTDPVMGSELVGSTSNAEGTIVGLAQVSAGVYLDTATNRQVASWFNPVDKECKFSPSADKVTASVTDVEVDATTRCTFVYTDGIGTRAKVMGSQGRAVRWFVSATVSNNTAGGGCQLNVNFDGGANEDAFPPTFLNPAGVVGGKFNIAFSGVKTNLTEGSHTMRLVVKETGAAGNCTVYKDNTTSRAIIPQ